MAIKDYITDRFTPLRPPVSPHPRHPLFLAGRTILFIHFFIHFLSPRAIRRSSIFSQAYLCFRVIWCVLEEIINKLHTVRLLSSGRGIRVNIYTRRIPRHRCSTLCFMYFRFDEFSFCVRSDRWFIINDTFTRICWGLEYKSFLHLYCSLEAEDNPRHYYTPGFSSELLINYK